MAKQTQQKTTRDKKAIAYFNSNKDTDSKTIEIMESYTATKDFKNIRLMGVEDGINVKGSKIKEHAKDNRTMKDLGYNKEVNTENISDNTTYNVYGSPFMKVLNNRQQYSDCGVESTLNTLATAGIIKMKENLSDQKSVEKDFLKKVWNLGLVSDGGVIGKLDEPDGGTEPDDYKDILRLYDIDSEAYFITKKCDDSQYGSCDADLNELGYKISQGYGAILGVSSSRLWKNTSSGAYETEIDHAVAIVGVVYADGVDPSKTDEYGQYVNAPTGFYIHDSGGWMTRYISLEEFKYVSLYEEHGMSSYDEYLAGKYVDYDPTGTITPMTEEEFEAKYTSETYNKNLRNFDSETREYTGKKPNGIFLTITTEPIKSDLFNLNATGDKQDNTIWGNSGNNVIKGMAGNDILYGNGGDDEIRGGKGKDIIIGTTLTKIDKDIFLEYLSKSGVTKVDTILNGVSLSNTWPDGRNSLYGDAGNDVIVGGEDIDLIYGGDGNDYIYTGDGRNAVYGGKGNDIIIGGWDNDRLFGDSGNDIIYGLGDDDTINGGAGNDTIYAGRGDDIIETGKDNDTIYFEGKEHGADIVSAQGGKTTFKFIDEMYNGVTVSDGADIKDMDFTLKQDENNNKLYNLNISYYNNDDATDGVTFNSLYNTKKGSQKKLDIIDSSGETYKVSVTKAKTYSTTTGNNVLFSLRDSGSKIVTGTGNDVVTMVGTNDSTNLSSQNPEVYDEIEYKGGIDRYVSEERNTYYYIDEFGSDTKLSIYDNVLASDKKVVSTDDRLFLDCKKTGINFFFNIGTDGTKAVTTEDNGLFVLNNLEDTARLINISQDNDNISGYIYMNSFFGENKEFTGTEFFGNGRIENICYDNGTTPYTDLSADLVAIAADVATWLNNTTYNTGGYSTAFDAFNHFGNLSETAQTALVACYNLNA